jgi:hypothetical protein
MFELLFISKLSGSNPDYNLPVCVELLIIPLAASVGKYLIILNFSISAYSPNFLRCDTLLEEQKSNGDI